MPFRPAVHAAGRATTNPLLRSVGHAQEAFYNKATLERWKQQPGFREAVLRAVQRITREMMLRGAARRDKRMRAIDDGIKRVQSVIAEHAADPNM